MALQSGTVKASFSESHTIILSWSEDSTSIDSNTSVISWRLAMTVGQYGHLGTLDGRRWEVTIGDNTEEGYATLDIYANESFDIASGATVVQHNNDGAKEAKIGFNVDINTGRGEEEWFGTVGNSTTVNLTVIPRASDLSVSAGTLGSEQSISADRKADGFTHTLTWVAGSRSGVIATMSSATSWSFTPPMDVAEEIPNSESIMMIFTLETYSGSSLVGSKSESVEMSIPGYVVPSVDFTIDDTTEYFNTLGKYLQYQSSLHIVATAIGAYGSSIISYKIEANGETFTKADAITGVLQDAGTQKVKVTAVDSRSRSVTAIKSIEIQSYNTPRITLLTVHRCNKDGVENQSGKYARVTYSYVVSTESTGTPTLKYKKATDTGYVSVDLPQGQSAENATYIFPADDGFAYDIELTISDSFGTSTRRTSVSTGYTILHFPASGKGLSIGKVATGDGFDVGMEATFSAGVKTLPCPISVQAEDTVENWAKMNNNVFWFSSPGILIDQPSQYGFLVNFTYGYDVFQIWHTQANGGLFIRSGNLAGWVGSWSLIGNN